MKFYDNGKEYKVRKKKRDLGYQRTRLGIVSTPCLLTISDISLEESDIPLGETFTWRYDYQ